MKSLDELKKALDLEIKEVVKIKWYEKSKRLPDKGRVLAFSPVYPKGHEMRYRILDSQFLKFTEEVTHWMFLDDVEPT